MVKHGYGCMYFIENIESNVVIIIIIMVLTLTPWLFTYKVGRSLSGFAGDLHRMLTRRGMGLDQGALVLLTTCEI